MALEHDFQSNDNSDVCSSCGYFRNAYLHTQSTSIIEDIELLKDVVDDIKDEVAHKLKDKYPQPFITKDSGQRQEFSTGMQRDIQTGKPRYDLIWQPGLKRLAGLMARGAEKYSDRNWEKASTQEELDRFKASAYRHFVSWFMGEEDEDHMAGAVFNLFGAEYVKEKLDGNKK